MKGFFDIKDVQSTSRPSGKVNSCASCGLYKNCKHPKMKAIGNFQKGILIIGGSPSEREDHTGKPFSDKLSNILKDQLTVLGIDLYEDCASIYACRCFVKNWKGAESSHVDNCRRFVLKTISELQPTLIILLGDAAINSIISHRWKRNMGGVQKWRGWQIPDQDFKAWICPTFSLSFVEKSEKEVLTIFKADLSNAIEYLGKALRKYKKPEIRYLESLTELNSIKEGTSCAFDYETTGLKPHAKGHRIVCASIAVSEDLVYTFEMPKSKVERKPFIDFLANPLIAKRAHNMKFEQAWSVIRLKQPVVNWEFDSMLAAHILDNRTGVTGLKFQTYVQFGIVDYDSEVAPYLHSGSKDGNALNNIVKGMEIMKKDILTYCAMDSIFEYRLSELQIEIMNYDFLPF